MDYGIDTMADFCVVMSSKMRTAINSTFSSFFHNLVAYLALKITLRYTENRMDDGDEAKIEWIGGGLHGVYYRVI